MTTRVTSSRLVGRTSELAALADALAGAASGRPSLAFLAGDSGVGKTRLLAELAARAADRGARVLAGECVELGEGGIPYAPIVGALRPLARDGDPALDALDARARGELARLLPALGAPRADAGGPEGDGAAQARLFEALLALLDRLAADAPVLLVLEDLHWADRSTRAFVAFLVGTLSRERVLVVASYRTDELHRRHPLRPLLAQLAPHAGPGGAVHRVQLPPLTRDELSAALEDILASSPSAELVDRLFARSEGNPLFMEELLATGMDGRGALPDTLRDALMVRIERLTEPAQELLRVLAVGQQLDHALLADASGLEPGVLRAAVREAVASHLVVADAEGRHTFRHALLREVVVDDLLPGERTQLHLAMARALERRIEAEGATTAAAGQLAAGVAHHYAAAAEQSAALAASIRAAEAADDMHAYGEAAALLERALELWDRVADAEALSGMDRVSLLMRAADMHQLAGDSARSDSLLRAALDRVDAEAEPRRAAAVLVGLAQAQWREGRSEDALASARRGLELVPAGEPTSERAALLSWFAKARMLQSRFREAVVAAREALETAHAAGDEASVSGALNALGVSLMAEGTIDEGIEALECAAEVARAAGRPGELASASLNLADSLHLAGRTAEALEMAMRGASDDVDPGCSVDCMEILVAEIAIDAGDWAEAQRRLAPHDHRMIGIDVLNADLRRAELALGRGDHDAATVALERANRLGAECSEPQFLGPLGALTAELHRRRGDLDAAREAVDVALDRIEFCSDDAMRLARVAAAGVAVEADRALRGRDLGDDAETSRALERAGALVERVRTAADGGRRPVESAWLATAEAYAGRAGGADDPAAWNRASVRWAAIARPYQAALAAWREAEAHAAADDRAAAAAAAATALGAARRMGAEWLACEVEGLAARARLRLAEDCDAPGAACADDGGAAPEHAADEPFGLTPRERQVLTLVAQGATNREIGRELFMAEKTASVHVSRILSKLDVRSRTQAAAVAHRLGLSADEAA